MVLQADCIGYVCVQYHRIDTRHGITRLPRTLRLSSPIMLMACLLSSTLAAKYFDDNNVYKGELIISADGTPAVISNVRNLFPTYEFNGITKDCDISNWDGFDYYDNSFHFSKAGTYNVGFSSAEYGSNFELQEYATFIVTSEVPLNNPTPTLTGVPDDDVLIGDNGANFTITATNLEQMVNWEVTCNNAEIEVNHWTDTSDDESNLEIELWANSAGISGTVTVKAWYDGHKDGCRRCNIRCICGKPSYIGWHTGNYYAIQRRKFRRRCGKRYRYA